MHKHWRNSFGDEQTPIAAGPHPLTDKQPTLDIFITTNFITITTNKSKYRIFFFKNCFFYVQLNIFVVPRIPVKNKRLIFI